MATCVLYLVSTETLAGKTALCAGLARWLTGTGRSVGYLKPLTVPLPGDNPDAGDDDWKGRWVRFAGSLSGMVVLEEGASEQDRENWIGDAVAAFCRMHRFRERFGATVFEGGER